MLLHLHFLRILLWGFFVQRSVSSEQNHLRLQQNLELDQLLKEGCTFTVLDQPISLDRLQLKNIDQLNASSKYTSSNIFVFFLQRRFKHAALCQDSYLSSCLFLLYLMKELCTLLHSIGAATFFHHNAPQQVPTVYRGIHPASCVRVCQGKSIQP